MSFYFSVKDSLRQAVESASGGRATVLYDDKGLPCYMVIIPAFNLEDIDADLGTGLHPAFIVDGQEKSEVYIGMFPVTDVVDNRAYCLPQRTPYVNVTFDDARTYCKNKGTGWHLMTAHEWAAVMLWCLKNGFEPRGNTNYGRYHGAHYETGVRSAGGRPGSTTPGDGKTLTGTGPASWRHDNTTVGIADLVGNVLEKLDGVKLVDGRVYCTQDNNFNLSESSWTAMNAYFVSPVAGDDVGSDNLGAPILSSSPPDNINTFYAGTSGKHDYNQSNPWRDISVESGYDPPLLLKQLAIAPKKWDAGSSSHIVVSIYNNASGDIFLRNYEERIVMRGSAYWTAENSGIASIMMTDSRSNASSSAGFRVAYVS